VKFVLMATMEILLEHLEKFNFVNFVIVMEILIQMLLEIVTEQLESALSVFIILMVLIVINVYQDILEIHLVSLMEYVKHVNVIHVEQMKMSMEFQSAIKYQEIVNVNQMLSERIVMNVKTDFGIFKVEKDVKIVNVIQLDHIIHLAILTLVNVSVSLE
jgi:hypothetical protein